MRLDICTCYSKIYAEYTAMLTFTDTMFKMSSNYPVSDGHLDWIHIQAATTIVNSVQL